MQDKATLLQSTTKLSSDPSTSGLTEVSLDSQQTELRDNSKKLGQNLLESQEIVCNFFLTIVKHQLPDLVLKEFEQLFINPVLSANSQHRQALHLIILNKDERFFINTLRRCCYILVNNWISVRNYQHTRELIQLFYKVNPPHALSPLIIKHLKTWMVNFVNSKEYQELKLFVAKYENPDKSHWKSRYTCYLLASQYTDSKNPTEQREAARALSNQLKEQFKMELAMYTVRSESAIFNDKKIENPTALGDEALRLIKKIVAKRGAFSYKSLANIFLNQTQNLRYKDFKLSLIKYLIFSEHNKGLVENLKNKIGENLELVYEKEHENELNNHLLLKTCNRVIEYLTTEKRGEPSSLFVLLASQGNPLTLAVLLVKVILICPQSRTHLETSIGRLIQYYEVYSQEECQWVINFLEVLKIILTIYTDNVQYNLVKMENGDVAARSGDENVYRVFSQSKNES